MKNLLLQTRVAAFLLIALFQTVTAQAALAGEQDIFLQANLHAVAFCPLLQGKAAISGTSSSLRISEQADLERLGEGEFRLTHGELLLEAKSPFKVHCDSYIVNVSSDTLVLLSNQLGTLKVCNLSSRNPGSVLVKVSEKFLQVLAGEEIAVSPSFESLSRAVARDGVLRRNTAMYDLSCGGTLLHSEVVASNALRRSRLLRELARSSDLRDKRLLRKTMKMAICLDYARKSGRYEYMVE